MRLALLIASVVLSTFLAVIPGNAESRVALVIGNSAYRDVPRLVNPVNDAEMMADTLRGLGFILVGDGAQLNLDKLGIDRAVQTFGRALVGADVALFYYAGHGIELRGTNYLLPVDAKLDREADVDFEMLNVNLVLRQMEEARTRLNLLILDACRNNPFGGRVLRGIGSGLASMESPDGTLIAFATEPGNFATDGEEGNSPYTKALAAAMRQAGLGVYDTFNQTGIAVRQATNGAQRPWFSSSAIAGSFYFAAPPAGSPAVDEIVWNALKDTNDVAALRRFIAEYPGSPRVGEAKTRTAALAAPSLRSRVTDVRRFDGVWIAVNVCESTPSGLPGWRNEFVGRVRDGVFHFQHGPEGKPGSDAFDGMITSDGIAEISQKGFSGEKEKDPFHRPKGTEFRNTYVGSFDEAHGTATRTDRASCKFDFTKQTDDHAKQGVPSAQPSVTTTLSDVPTSTTSTTVFAPPRPTSSAGERFDGLWIGKIDCEAKGVAQAYSYTFVGRVKDGVFHGEKGVEGRPGWMTFDGTIRSDGGITLVNKGLTDNPATTLNNEPPGRPATFRAYGSFEGSRGSALRTEGRTCRLEFTKEEPTRAVEGRGGNQPGTQATPRRASGPRSSNPTKQ